MLREVSFCSSDIRFRFLDRCFQFGDTVIVFGLAIHGVYTRWLSILATPDDDLTLPEIPKPFLWLRWVGIVFPARAV